MNTTNYSKAVKCGLEDDFCSFIEWSQVEYYYDSTYGLVIVFPKEVENYGYIAIDNKICYIYAEINGETRSVGSL